ncbi:hypothetical protein BX600DRAFT_545966 [Xylariales sp. PMI_506]|nr:hypothetical protein BX600DRAFT_545966 [Xylariales sp. PMI_506]
MASESQEYKLPSGAWDSHVHIIDEDRWKIADDASFHPKQATLTDLENFEKSIGIEHACLIGISVYGTNNDSMIDAVQRNSKLRAVAVLDLEKTTDAELDQLHSIGFRGARVNLRTTSGAYTASQWKEKLGVYYEKLRRLDWVLQIFVSMNQIADIAPVIEGLGDLKVVFDHLGHPEPPNAPADQVGCKELYHLLEHSKRAYIKLSGIYRLQGVPRIDEHVLYLLEHFPDQVVWGSDWPHTAGPDYNPGGDRKAVQDFLPIDIPSFVKQCLSWCKYDPVLIKKIWVDNPRTLWDYNV